MVMIGPLQCVTYFYTSIPSLLPTHHLRAAPDKDPHHSLIRRARMYVETPELRHPKLLVALLPVRRK